MSQEGTVQGDPLSTCIYAIGLRPLIDRINHQDTKQLWYFVDAAATGTLDALCEWWSKLINEGPKFGYLPNPQKTWLVTETSAKDSGIQVTIEGRPYLGSAIGSDTYTCDYVTNHIRKWNTELNTLATFGKSQPHAAYTFIHGFSSKWSFLMRTTVCDCHLYQPLEDTITNHFILAISGRNSITEEERDLLALPIRMGGLDITNPTLTSSLQYTASKKITKPLTDHIVQQCPSVSTDIVDK